MINLLIILTMTVLVLLGVNVGTSNSFDLEGYYIIDFWGGMIVHMSFSFYGMV